MHKQIGPMLKSLIIASTVCAVSVLSTQALAGGKHTKCVTPGTSGAASCGPSKREAKKYRKWTKKIRKWVKIEAAQFTNSASVDGNQCAKAVRLTEERSNHCMSEDIP